jgi:hypothetical protein
MKKLHLHFLYLRFSFFVSSCNNTKAADEKSWKKIAVVAVDSVKKKQSIQSTLLTTTKECWL